MDRLTPTGRRVRIPKEFMERDAIHVPAQSRRVRSACTEWASGLQPRSRPQPSPPPPATLTSAAPLRPLILSVPPRRIERRLAYHLDLSRRTGTDISAAYQRNLGAAMSIAGPVQGPPAPPQQPAAAPAATAQASASSAEVVAAAHSARDAQRDTSAELISTLKDIKHEQRILREQIKSIRARD